MKDFEYAKARKEKEQAKKKQKRKWWLIDGKHYSYYIWAAPVVPFFELADYIKNRNYKKRVWDTEKASKVIDATLPHILEYDEEDDCYWLSFDWSPYLFEKHAPRHLRKWAHKFAYQVRAYVFEDYQKEGWVKTIDDEDEWNKWAIFHKEEK